MARVSIITPTKDREQFLPVIWKCVKAQSESDFEWLVHDSSKKPSKILGGIADDRIRYFHDPAPMTIGAKRNVLCAAAKGDIIVQFDDDDHYAPHYIERMTSFMREQGADFVKLFGFFLYCHGSDLFAYWDLEYDLPVHFRLAPNAALQPAYYSGDKNSEWGFGFSYVFRKHVWQVTPFADRDHGEDREFAMAAVKKFKAVGMQDHDNLCVHVLHTTNTSIAFPQKVLRRTYLGAQFPTFPNS